MPRIDWAVGILITFFLVVSVLLLRIAFGVGDRRRDRAELRRSAQRAEPKA